MFWEQKMQIAKEEVKKKNKFNCLPHLRSVLILFLKFWNAKEIFLAIFHAFVRFLIHGPSTLVFPIRSGRKYQKQKRASSDSELFWG